MEHISGELKDLEVEEISLVDVPAIGRKFVIMKRGATVEEQEVVKQEEVVEEQEEVTEQEVVEKQEEIVEEQEVIEKQEEVAEEKQDQEEPVTKRLEAIESRLEALDANVAKILEATESFQVVSKRLAERKAAVKSEEPEVAEDKPKSVSDVRKALRKQLEVRFGVEG